MYCLLSTSHTGADRMPCSTRRLKPCVSESVESTSMTLPFFTGISSTCGECPLARGVSKGGGSREPW